MMLIRRKNYLERIGLYLDKPIIKVITGMRRVGKSTILQSLKNELLSKKIKQKNIIWINKESLEFDFIKDYNHLYKYVKTNLADVKGNKYLFIDEIQEISNWEKAVASIFTEKMADIILTGSNAHILSSELATYISGRYVEIPIYPLTFSEFLLFSKNKQLTTEENFKYYLKYGGLPAVNIFVDEEAVDNYLNSIINTVLLKDVIKRNKIRDVELLERLVLYLMDNVGNITTAKSISDYFKSQKVKVSVDTIQNYIKYLESAFLFYRVPRYDIKGKKYLEYFDKLFMGDIGLRNGFIGYKDKDISGILENIVFLEMKKRGYKITIGTLGGYEIDFIAEKQNEKIYIQVARALEQEKTIQREFGNLEKITDNYKKIVLSMDKYFQKDYNGIEHKFLPEFLLELS